MQNKKLPHKILSVALSLLMMLTIIPLLPATTADAKYSTEYYYPEGTKLIKDIVIYYSGNRDKAKNAIKGVVGADGYLLDVNLNWGTDSDEYIYMGWTYTTNPNEAVRGFRIDHNGSVPDCWTQSGVNWYPINSGVHTWVPQFNTDGCVDLNKGNSGSDALKLYITKDPSFGPPLTQFVVLEGSTNRDNYNAAGWTPVVTFQNNSNQVDITKGSGGEKDLFCAYNTNCVKIDSSALRSAYNSTTGYDKVEGYTAASIGLLSGERNTAKAIIDMLDSATYQGCCTSSQATINSVANNMTYYVNNLQTNLYLNASENGGTGDKTIAVTVGKNKTAAVDLSKYTATKAGADFAGWADSALAKSGTTGTVTVGFNETYYALFGVELTVTFHYLLADGTLTSTTKNIYAMNAATAASTPLPSLKDATVNGKTYTPIGWREDTKAEINTIKKTGIYTVYTSNPTVDVYAVYEGTLSFNYDTHKGTEIAGESVTQYLNANTEITKSSYTFNRTESKPVREGGTFLGWAMTANDKDNLLTDTQFTTTEDITLHAVYDLTYYTVEFYDGDGKVISTQSVAHGDAAALPESTPTKAYTEDKHYVFNSWVEDFDDITGDLDVTASFDEVDHEFDVDVITAADCLNDGEETHTCECGYSKPVHVDALGHDKSNTPGTPATCTKDGTSDYIVCLRCNTVLQEKTTIPATGHKYKLKEAQTATCSTGGYELWVCENNEAHTEIRNKVSPTGVHKEIAVKGYKATCTKNGLTDGSECQYCGCVLTPQNIILADGHQLVTDKYVAPTCFETGLTEGTHCKNCDYKVAQKEIAKLEHDWSDFTAKAATCTEDGYTAGSECRYCHTIKDSVVIPATKHNWKTNVVEATCTEDGYTEYICKNNSAHNYTVAGEPAKGHTGGEATCVAKAVCENCQQPYGEKANHDYVETVFPATCTSQGFTRYTCKNCPNTYDADYTALGAHVYNDGIITTVPGCCTDGEKTFTCLYCPDSYTETVSATGHDVDNWTVEGTEASGTCNNCGETITADPEDVGLELPECERCGMVHRYNSGIFKYKGIYCSIVYFFRQVVNFFKGNA